MSNLTDYIEDYLKKMLVLSNNPYIEIKRREVAVKFCCVPSQINYVLKRRFPLERGYLVESRPGGGGCIRIYRIEPGPTGTWREIVALLQEEDNFEPARVRQLLKRMGEEKVISRRELALLEAVIGDDAYAGQGLSDSQVRRIQRRLFAEAFEELLKENY